MGAEVQTTSKHRRRIGIVCQQTQNRFADDQGNVAFKADAQPSLVTCSKILLLCRVDPNVAVSNYRWVCLDVVGPQVKRSATGEVETGVMPMAGEDAVAYGTAMKWETHVWTTIIYGVNIFAVDENGES
jgi:hypothetical protein